MAVHRSARRIAPALVLALVAGAAACDSPLSERTIDLDATGAARVTLFLDNNLNAQFDPTVDLALSSRSVVVRRVGAADSTLAQTDQSGVARIDDLDIGRYVATIPGSVRGDTLVSALDTVEFQLGPLDTASIALGVQYPEIDVADFRELDLGRRAWIRSVVFSTPLTFGDSTMHVADTTAAIRAINIRVNLPVSLGDTLDLLGARRARSGQPALEPILAIPVAGGLLPPPLPVTTAEAASADGGTLDAAFVVVRNAEVKDTATLVFEGQRLLTVDDGSGPVVVPLPPGMNPAGVFELGIVLQIRGVLVPDDDEVSWILRPRMPGDIDRLVTPTPP